MIDSLKPTKGSPYASKKMRVVKGTKWECPLPKSKDYWQKFCDREERKLIRVSYPFPKLSYFPFSRDKLFHRDPKSGRANKRSYIEASSIINPNKVTPLNTVQIPSPGSLHFAKTTNNCIKSRVGTKLKHEITPKKLKKGFTTMPPTKIASNWTQREKNKFFRENDEKALGEILKSFLKPHPTIPTNFENVPARQIHRKDSCPFHRNEPPIKIFDDDIEKYLEIPEEIISEELGAIKSKIPSENVKQKKSSENVQKNFKNNLAERTMPESSELLRASEKDDSTIVKKKDSEIEIENVEIDFGSDTDTVKTVNEILQVNNEKIKETGKRHSKNQYLKYPIRCAYKALKMLTPNKTLDFTPKFYEESQESSSSGLSDSTENQKEFKTEAIKKFNSEESLSAVQSRLRKQWRSIQKLDSRTSATKKPEKSISIASTSRSTSGPSTKFVDFEKRKTRTTRVLEMIPTMSKFPRKTADRCFCCLYKPFEASKQATFNAHKLFSTISKEEKPESIDELSENDIFDSITSPDTLVETASAEIKSAELEKRKELPETSFIDTSSSRRPDNEAQADVPADKIKPLEPKEQQKDKNQSSPKKEDVIVSSPKSSDSEDELSAVGMDQTTSSKYLAPCHMPTVLCPSLEPLKALRHKTPALHRITFDETKGQEDTARNLEKAKEPRNDVPGTAEPVKEVPAKSRILSKVKSVAENLIPASTESPSRKTEALRRGSSCSNISLLPEDSAKDIVELVRRTQNASQEGAKLPLTSMDEIFGVLRRVGRDAPAVDMLEALSNEFSMRLSRTDNASPRSAKLNKMACRLTKLLAESKRYLRRDKFPSDLVFSHEQPPLCNSRLLRSVLPLDSYNLVAPLLGMPSWYPRRRVSVQKSKSEAPTSSHASGDSDSESNFDLAVHPPTEKEVTVTEDEDEARPRLNPYASFLKKPRRKVVTWRPLTEKDLKGYDPEATLSMRARNITEKICREFCEWLRGLGGTHKVIDEEVLRDMFEIDFTADACRTMQVAIKEMPTVPAEVAESRNCPNAGELAMTRNQLIRDARAEEQPKKIRAFGKAIPWEFRFVPPSNRVREKWLDCKNVPQDLETMSTVWDGIAHLDSVQGFIQWLKDHPEVSPPEALQKAISQGNVKHVHGDETYAHLELELDQISSLKVGNGVVV